MLPFDEPEFWNPNVRLPLCLNPPAARSHLPLTFKTTELALSGASNTQMFDRIKAAFEKKELPMPEPSAMCYMMSKQVLWPQGWERGSPSDVWAPQNKRYGLGRGPPRLTSVRASILSATDHRVHHFCLQVVGSNGWTRRLVRSTNLNARARVIVGNSGTTCLDFPVIARID
jgi:hypothetical protein